MSARDETFASTANWAPIRSDDGPTACGIVLHTGARRVHGVIAE